MTFRTVKVGVTPKEEPGSTLSIDVRKELIKILHRQRGAKGDNLLFYNQKET